MMYSYPAGDLEILGTGQEEKICVLEGSTWRNYPGCNMERKKKNR